MLREQSYTLKWIAGTIDFLLCGSAVVLCYAIRNEILAPYFLPNTLMHSSSLTSSWWLVLLCPAVMSVTLWFNGCYDLPSGSPVNRCLRKYIGPSILTAFVAMSIGFFTTGRFAATSFSSIVLQDSVSRGVLLLYPFVTIGLIWLRLLAGHSILQHYPKFASTSYAVAVIGNANTVNHVLETLNASRVSAHVAALHITDSAEDKTTMSCLHPETEILSSMIEIIKFAETKHVDEVIFACDDTPLSELRPIFEELETMGIKSQLALTFFTPGIGSAYGHTYANRIAAVTYSPVSKSSFGLLFKSVFDRVTALLLLLAISPLFLAIYLMVKYTSDKWSDPVFYGQIRCGLNGKLFRLWKFRSMYLDADKRKAELMSQNIMSGPTFKMKEDPRVTPIGRILRKTSLDELPQIWNVLCGEMSLVGPRPPIPSEVAQYDRWQRRRLSMKPGITCLWQVMGRNHLPFETWMKLDLQYIDNWSFWLDIKILFRTVYVVFTGYGAM